MRSASRFAVLFGLPALLLLTVSVAVWLALGSNEPGFGPMRLMPLPPSGSSAAAAAVEPPSPTQIERLSPLQAKIQNALLPFARSPRGLASAYLATTEPRAAALECLTRAIYYEAAREPELGKRAVAQVIVNRASSSPFPNTICGVVEQGAARPGCQFTFMCDGSLARRPDPSLWAQARQVADAFLEGGTEPSVGDATHYHADYVFPTWAPTMSKIVKIGAHIFYRWRAASPRPALPASVEATPTQSLPAVGSATPEPTAPIALPEPEVGPAASAAAVPSTEPTASTVVRAEPVRGSSTPSVVAQPLRPDPAGPGTREHPRRAIPDRPLGSAPF